MTRTIDTILILWLAIGVPLAWAKGGAYPEEKQHVWIGVEYSLVTKGVCMELPAQFLDELREEIEPFCQTRGSVSRADAERLLGRIGRVAYIVPAARPFASTLWAALGESRRAAARKKGREAPPGRYASRRFAPGATWFRALLRGVAGVPLRLRRVVTKDGQGPRTSAWHAEIDASPWGEAR